MKQTKRITSVMMAVLLVLVALLSVACQPNEPQKFTITFETFDGKSKTVEVMEGELVTPPENPSNRYAKFLGWCADAELKTPWDATAPATASTTVYANWEYRYTITITFDTCDGKEPTTTTGHTGFLFSVPSDPTREYWTFSGWYYDAECTDKYSEGDALTKNRDFTMYAGWTILPDHAHTFTFDKTVAPTCTTVGYDLYTCVCGTNEHRNEVATLPHDVENDQDYMRFQECASCGQTLRIDSLRTYDQVFKYEFTQERADEIDAAYAELLEILESVERYSSEYARTWNEDTQSYDTSKDVAGLWEENKQFEEKFNAYDDSVMYVIEQYQYAYVFYCVYDGDPAYEEAYEFISEFRTDIVKDYYSLYRLIYETKYREFFFAYDEGWTDDDIQLALNLSDQYGGEEYAELNKQADDIAVEFRAIEDAATSGRVLTLYSQFVEVNNQIAQLAGYDNYMDYAYENIYERDYTPEDVIVMRQYVKEYIGPMFKALTEQMEKPNSLNANQIKYYEALSSKSIFQNPLTADLVADYFDLLKSPAGQAGTKEIDFAHHANELFKHGNYYTGDYEGAFSYFVRAHQKSILYFGPGSYSGAFTFVHEFGHYYETVYNPGASISYDLEETHSQGNEMLFLAYVSSVLEQNNATPAFLNLMYDNIWNSLAIGLLATAVDEFEQIAYTGEYYGNNVNIKNIVADGVVSANEYDRVFTALLTDYGVNGILNPSYWRYVVIESPGYYISYSMSALPSIELFVLGTQDFESAKQSYFKLFTFTDDENYAYVDKYGDLVVTAGYEDTLHYAGLYSPFEEELYTTLQSYFGTGETEPK